MNDRFRPFRAFRRRRRQFVNDASTASADHVVGHHWVTVVHLASHILARMAKRLSADWERLYQHPIYFVETFVDPTRFRGTCYRAANWIRLGETTGRGKDDHTNRPNRSIKEVLGYPLTQRFRALLQEV